MVQLDRAPTEKLLTVALGGLPETVAPVQFVPTLPTVTPPGSFSVRASPEAAVLTVLLTRRVSVVDPRGSTLVGLKEPVTTGGRDEK